MTGFDRQPHLVGELVELRPLVPDDFDALFAVASDPLVWEQHPSKERAQIDGFRLWMKDALESGGALTAIDRKDGRVIGSSRFHGYDAEKSEIEIGWTFLARSHWGGVYNGEMKELMLRHAFPVVDTVLFLVHRDNMRSQKAVEKLGAVRLGFAEEPDRSDHYVFRLTQESYGGSPSSIPRAT